jgi:NitT/TauT family transport system ATP-binding protein
VTAITLTNIVKRFGEVIALQDVNLEVSEGEFVSLIGPSGCGKTTLLRIIAGLIAPSSGLICVFDNTPREAIKQSQIGMIFQQSSLFPFRTALKNVSLTLDITKHGNGTTPKELLTHFGLGNFLNHYPHQLSGGMQQRVNLAANIIHSPRVLLMDEPFGALDELTREDMTVWLSNILTEYKRSVILVTHSIDEAVTLSDRVIIMSPSPGQIVSQVKIDLPKPRDRVMRTQNEYLRFVAQVRQELYKLYGV